MAQFLATIGRHFDYAIQTELVVELELALFERKQSGALKVLLCSKCGAIPTIISGVTAS